MITLYEMKQSIAQSRKLREHFLADPFRPGYHFVPPEDKASPGDPNCAFYANGRYHLMYLYECVSDGYRFGHLSSLDLLHWRVHPDALLPDELDGGIFSGGAFVDDDGTAYMAYWSLPVCGNSTWRHENPFCQNAGGIRIAYSRDVENHYTKWEKMPEMAIRDTEFGVSICLDDKGNEVVVGGADPSNIWKDNGRYYMQTGNLLVLNQFRDKVDVPKTMLGDHTDLFCSEDLKTWTYCHRFYDRREDNRWTDESEDDMCPVFFPLPASEDGGAPTDRYLQLFIAHNKGCQYYIGKYDREALRFIPEQHGRMSWKDNTFFAPEALVGPDGRLIMWAWLLDNPPGENVLGWSGVYGVPRNLWLNAKGGLGIAPIQELDRLEYNHRCNTLEGVARDSCRLRLRFSISNGKAGVTLFASENGETCVKVYYDADLKELVFDTTASDSLCRREYEHAPLTLQENETLELDIFVDRSVVDVFANKRQAITRRVCSPQYAKGKITLLTEGDGALIDLKASDMMPTNPY